MYRAVSYFIVFVLTVLTLFRCFSGISIAPLQKWDENTNVRVVRESVDLKSFPVLYLDGVPFFEKPPLWYWVHSLIPPAGNLLLSMRFINALLGFFTILVSVYISFSSWGRASAVITWCILLASHQLFITNPGGIFSTHTLRSADVDSLTIFLIICMTHILISNRKNKAHLIMLGILSGLAVLSKGPIGIVPICIHIAIRLRRNTRVTSKSLYIPVGLLLLIVLPWYTFMTYSFGNEFITNHFFYHIARRVLIPLEGHIQPWWYYIYLFSGFHTFPGFIFLVISFLWSMYRNLLHGNRALQIIYVLFFIYFFTPMIIQTKLAWYILPAYPFAAILTGAVLSDCFRWFSVSRV